MRIAISCRSFLKKQYTGIGRYAFNLVDSLQSIDRDNEYWLYVRKGLFDFKRKTPEFRSPRFAVKYDYFSRGPSRTLSGIDLYHCPSPEFFEKFTRTVVTVHDLIFKSYPEGHTEQAREVMEKQMADIVRFADKIICCSKSTKMDLIKYYNLGEPALKVIYQGIDHATFYPIKEEDRPAAKDFLAKKGVTVPFILFVGTLEPRKNLAGLLEALSSIKSKGILSHRLVIVGMQGWMMETLSKRVKELDLKRECIFLGYVEDSLLRCLYNFCDAFVFPSHYEGFGYPILEALSCGAPVIASQTSSCAEIVKDAGLTIDPKSPQEIAQALMKVYEDNDLRLKLKKKSVLRAAEFSFEKTARETLDLYTHLGGQKV